MTIKNNFFASRLGQIWNQWVSFAFETDAKKRFQLFEILFPTVLLSHILTLIPDLKFFYTNQGLVPSDKTAELIEMKGRFSILSIHAGAGWVYFCYTIFVLAILCMIFGRFRKIAAFVALAMHVSFIHRNVTVAFGMDLISIFFLFYLILGSESVQAKKGTWRTEIQSLGLRLAQLQLCVIYAYSGIEKLKGITWWRGEAMWYAVSNPQLGRFDLTWMAHVPILIVLGTYLPLVWEVYFPAIIWIPALRKWVLGFGVLFHMTIAVFMGLPHFGMVMITVYALFLTEKEAGQVLDWFVQIKSKAFKRMRVALN